jgi:acyl-CoA thioester hydrolase
MNDRHPLLAEFPVVLTLPVLWGDQDAFGHVNNLVYLRWCETARVEYLCRIAQWPKLPPEGVGPILASIHCDYKRPLNYPDVIQVGARVTRIGNSSMRMEHSIVSMNLDALAATADSTLVLLDYNRNQAVPVPGEARKIIGDLEGKNFEPAPR